MEKLRVIFLQYVYPSSVIETTLRQAIQSRVDKPPLDPDKNKKAFLRLSQIGLKRENF